MAVREYIRIAKYTFKNIFDRYHNQSSQIQEEKLSVVEQRHRKTEEEKNIFQNFAYFAWMSGKKYCLTKKVSEAQKLILRDQQTLSTNDQILYIYRLAELIEKNLLDKEQEDGCMFDRKEIHTLYKWIKEGANVNALTSKAESNTNKASANNPQQYKLDIKKLAKVYTFCIDTGVIDNSISNVDFINAASYADFKQIYANAEQQKSKSKCKYIIFVISKFAGGEWYLDTTNGIGIKPNKCSGANIPADWKRDADAIK